MRIIGRGNAKYSLQASRAIINENDVVYQYKMLT